MSLRLTDLAAEAPGRAAGNAPVTGVAYPKRTIEYGLRLGVADEPCCDPRERCPPAWRALLPEGPISALYFGTEFCEDRLPEFARAKAFCDLSRDRGWEPTLLTPLVTPNGLRAVSSLLGLLAGAGCTPAVVFNDWGVLGLLRERHPDLRRRAGRLINRTLRDPRAYRDAPSGSARHDSTRFERLRRLLAELGVIALESDVDLEGGYLGDGERLSRALHVPYTFAASGRACPLKAHLYPEGGGLAKALADPCPAPCCGKPLTVRRDDTPLPHWRGGNTLFYEVPLEAAQDWLAFADRIVVHVAAMP